MTKSFGDYKTQHIYLSIFLFEQTGALISEQKCNLLFTD